MFLWYEILLLILLALMMAVMAFLDSTRILVHLFIFTGIASTLVLLNEYIVDQILNRKVDDERWKVYLILAASFYAISVATGYYSPMLTTLFAVLWLASMVPLLCTPFDGRVYPGSLPAAITIAAALATAFGIINWTMGLLIILKFGLMAALRIKNNKTDPASEQQMTPTLKRILISIGYGIFAMASLGISAYWIALSIDYHWTMEPVEAYSLLRHIPHSFNAQRIKSTSDLRPYRDGGIWRIKPNVCTTGITAKTCEDYACLKEYISQCPSKLSWVIQQHFPEEKETIVFYYRYPYLHNGRILSITGNTTLFPDAQFFDRIADRIPGFSGGQFIVIMRGAQPHVLDVKALPLGCMEEKALKEGSWGQAISRWARRHRTALLQTWFGVYNILSGRQWDLFVLFSSMPQLLKRYALCDRHPEHLWAVP